MESKLNLNVSGFRFFFCLFWGFVSLFVSSLLLFVYCLHVSDIRVRCLKMRTKQSFYLPSACTQCCDFLNPLVSVAEKYFKKRKQKKKPDRLRVKNMTWLAMLPLNPASPRHLLFWFLQMFIQVATFSILQPTVSYLIAQTLSPYLQKWLTGECMW